MSIFSIHEGDCLDALRAMPDASVDAVITDPPYGLSDHRPAEVLSCLTAWVKGEPYTPKARGGFMGRQWDAWVPGPEVWREALRVLKPGGHLLAFAGTRSMDLMSMAVRLAGFELRDAIGYAHDAGGPPLLAWCYSTGFPKSLDVSKAIDKAAGAEREVVGRAENWGASKAEEGRAAYGDYAGGWDITAPATDAARQWAGWGTALKPAWEPVILARKPLVGTVAENVLAHGTGALNVDGCRVGAADNPVKWSAPRGGIWTTDSEAAGVLQENTAGRWPANLIHDGSDAVVSEFPANAGAAAPVKGTEASAASTGNVTGERARVPGAFHADSGSAARFFYCAKASKRDRNSGGVNSTHPTVKPTDLMRYLCRLVTPPGGVVLDPFMGSGSTGKAAILEGFRFIGCEQSPEYIAIARARIGAALQAIADEIA